MFVHEEGERGEAIATRDELEVCLVERRGGEVGEERKKSLSGGSCS
jgi:hypothetical protein